MSDFNIKITEKPTANPITIQEMKGHLNLVKTETDFDSEIESFIESAVDECEGFTGLYFMKRSAQIYVDEFSMISIFYGCGPIQSIDFIEYKGKDGSWKILDPGEYSVDLISEIPRVKITGTFPDLIDDEFNRVRFNVVLGFSAGTEIEQQNAVPGRIKQAIKLRVARHFQTRDDKMIKGDLIHAADQLLFPFKSFV